MGCVSVAPWGGDTTGQHWRGRGDTVSPPSSPPPAVATANREGEKIMCVMGGRSYTLVLFCLYRLAFWDGMGRTGST